MAVSEGGVFARSGIYGREGVERRGESGVIRRREELVEKGNREGGTLVIAAKMEKCWRNRQYMTIPSLYFHIIAFPSSHGRLFMKSTRFIGTASDCMESDFLWASSNSFLKVVNWRFGVWGWG